MIQPTDARPRPAERRLRLPRPPTPAIGVVLAIAIVLALPLVAGGDPITQDLSNAIASPGGGHLLGTDQYGRDLASRLVFGARRTLLLSLLVMVSAATIGLVVGLLGSAVPRGGRWLVDRFIDIGLGLPSLVIALAVVGAMGPGQRNLVLALVVGVWPWYARLAREHSARVASLPFVQAARVAGVPRWRIWTRHVAPHVVRRLLVVAALDVGYTMVAFAGLSYLGLGAAPPTPELGVILREGQDYVLDAPWLLWAPSAVVLLLVLPFVLASEHLHGRGVVA